MTNELGIQISEEERESWEAYLDDFKTLVYPKLFEPHGFTFTDAVILWMNNRLYNAVHALIDAIQDSND